MSAIQSEKFRLGAHSCFKCDDDNEYVAYKDYDGINSTRSFCSSPSSSRRSRPRGGDGRLIIGVFFASDGHPIFTTNVYGVRERVQCRYCGRRYNLQSFIAIWCNVLRLSMASVRYAISCFT